MQISQNRKLEGERDVSEGLNWPMDKKCSFNHKKGGRGNGKTFFVYFFVFFLNL